MVFGGGVGYEWMVCKIVWGDWYFGGDYFVVGFDLFVVGGGYWVVLFGVV